MAQINPRLLGSVPTMTEGVEDNTRVGSFWVRLNQTVNLANTSIQHGLGRVPVGYIQTGTRAGGVLKDDGTQTGWDHDTIVLQASVAGNYDLWIF